jgi:hypothetical protein
MKKPLLLLIPLLVLILSSCGKFEVGIVAPTQSGTTDEIVHPTGETAELPPTSTPTPLPDSPSTLTPTEESPQEPDASSYWVVQQDPGLGFRFAVPCFWRVDLPAEDSYDLEGGWLYHAFNYPQEYPLSFPRSQIPVENNAIKVAFDVINIPSYGLPPGSSLREFVIQENSSGESEILEMQDESINGQPALSATIQYPNSTGRYFLIKINDEFFLRFSANPSPKLLNTPDVEGMLNSITIDSNIEVPLPTHIPAPPPIGLPAACIPEFAEAVPRNIDILPENTVCGLDSYKSLDFLTQAVEQGLQDRNTGGLRWEYRIHDPFVIGYWASEGAVMTPDEVATTLANSLYNSAQPGGMTFTTEREAFPPLQGIPPESLLDPAVNIVQVIYSEGWGLDDMGAALLYFAQDECDGFYWYGLVYSFSHFDK